MKKKRPRKCPICSGLLKEVMTSWRDPRFKDNPPVWRIPVLKCMKCKDQFFTNKTDDIIAAKYAALIKRKLNEPV